MIDLIYSLSLLVNHSVTLLYLEDNNTITHREFSPNDVLYLVSESVYTDTMYILLEDGTRVNLESGAKVKTELQFDLPLESVIPMSSLNRYLNLMSLCDPAMQLIQIRKEG